MKKAKPITILLCIVLMAITAWGLGACGEDNGVVPNAFKGKWVMCGLAPKDQEMAAENILDEKELQDIYGMDVDSMSENIVEFDKGGGMKPYTDGSTPGVSTDMVTRVSDTEVCYGLEILELGGKDISDDPVKMDVHARIVDGYLFVWEEYTNTDEYDASDTYAVYQKVK